MSEPLTEKYIVQARESSGSGWFHAGYPDKDTVEDSREYHEGIYGPYNVKVIKVTETQEEVERPAFPKPPYTKVRYKYKSGSYSSWISFNERPGSMKNSNRINVPDALDWIEFK
jgi:hypothetical protein